MAPVEWPRWESLEDDLSDAVADQEPHAGLASVSGRPASRAAKTCSPAAQRLPKHLSADAAQRPRQITTVRFLRLTVLALGVIGILLSLPLLGFAALGYLGILADVGPAENRQLGIQLLTWGLPALICGVVLCVLSFLSLVGNRRRADSLRGAARDGGSRPAARD